jgi:hypothetical protein
VHKVLLVMLNFLKVKEHLRSGSHPLGVRLSVVQARLDSPIIISYGIICLALDMVVRHSCHRSWLCQRSGAFSYLFMSTTQGGGEVGPNVFVGVCPLEIVFEGPFPAVHMENTACDQLFSAVVW